MTDLPRCRTCRHWVPSDAYDFGLHMRDCALARSAAPRLNRPKMETVGSKAFAYAARGPASLTTAPDFGCVQHEAVEGA